MKMTKITIRRVTINVEYVMLRNLQSSFLFYVNVKQSSYLRADAKLKDV
jgi:hypothetical protein